MLLIEPCQSAMEEVIARQNRELVALCIVRPTGDRSGWKWHDNYVNVILLVRDDEASNWRRKHTVLEKIKPARARRLVMIAKTVVGCKIFDGDPSKFPPPHKWVQEL